MAFCVLVICIQGLCSGHPAISAVGSGLARASSPLHRQRKQDEADWLPEAEGSSHFRLCVMLTGGHPHTTPVHPGPLLL